MRCHSFDAEMFVRGLRCRKDCYRPMAVLGFEAERSVAVARMDCSQASAKKAATLGHSLQPNTVLVEWTASVVQAQLGTGDVRHLCGSGRVAEDCLRR